MALDPITTILDIGTKVIDRLWPDPTQRDAAKLELLKLQQSGELAQMAADTDIAKAQIAVNQVEAASPNLFVSGWRPFIGWCCGAALAYAYIVQPFMAFVAIASGHGDMKLPEVGFDQLSPILFGMLGMSGLRSIERIKGKA